ncbi:copper transporter [Oerskovia flava]|uniref:copper transporter n=1 Tax=Oerskovia flava TaxID=2986422 RepID=UPI002240ACFC|nr:copper transporter [Oerskovia sp. JB1-3-2]
MIDFRYHIVSLISVFLALAVGIILGAGPLQGAIGDQLTGQVEQLRVERNELRDQLDAATVTVGNDTEFIEATGPQLLADSLTDRRVAVVDLGAVDAERYDVIAGKLEAAGASVAGHVQITDQWTAESEESARRTVAEGLGEYLDPVEDAAPEQRLATALAVALTEASSTDADARSETAIELESLLVRFDLLTVTNEQSEPADVILLLSGAAPVPTTPQELDEAEEGAEQVEPDTYVVDIEVELAVAAQQVSQAALVVGPTAVSGDLVSTIRGRDEVARTVSTVSGVEAEPGRIAVPLALAARLDGQVGQFGFEENATAVLPPSVELEPVDRTPAESETPTGSSSSADQQSTDTEDEG